MNALKVMIFGLLLGASSAWANDEKDFWKAFDEKNYEECHNIVKKTEDIEFLERTLPLIDISDRYSENFRIYCAINSRIPLLQFYVLAAQEDWAWCARFLGMRRDTPINEIQDINLLYSFYYYLNDENPDLTTETEESVEKIKIQIRKYIIVILRNRLFNDEEFIKARLFAELGPNIFANLRPSLDILLEIYDLDPNAIADMDFGISTENETVLLHEWRTQLGMLVNTRYFLLDEPIRLRGLRLEVVRACPMLFGGIGDPSWNQFVRLAIEFGLDRLAFDLASAQRTVIGAMIDYLIAFKNTQLKSKYITVLSRFFKGVRLNTIHFTGGKHGEGRNSLQAMYYFLMMVPIEDEELSQFENVFYNVIDSESDGDVIADTLISINEIIADIHSKHVKKTLKLVFDKKSRTLNKKLVKLATFFKNLRHAMEERAAKLKKGDKEMKKIKSLVFKKSVVKKPEDETNEAKSKSSRNLPLISPRDSRKEITRSKSKSNIPLRKSFLEVFKGEIIPLPDEEIIPKIEILQEDEIDLPQFTVNNMRHFFDTLMTALEPVNFTDDNVRNAFASLLNLLDTAARSEDPMQYFSGIQEIVTLLMDLDMPSTIYQPLSELLQHIQNDELN